MSCCSIAVVDRNLSKLCGLYIRSWMSFTLEFLEFVLEELASAIFVALVLGCRRV